MRILLATILIIFSPAAYANNVLHTFGNWRIERIEGNKSYLLIGIGDVSDPTKKFLGWRFFSLQCFEESPQITLMFPYDIRENSEKMDKVNMLIWADKSEPVEIPIYNLKGVLANIGGRENDKDATVATFINKLSNAEEAFSVGFQSKSIRYDMTDFDPAWSQYNKLCGHNNFLQQNSKLSLMDRLKSGLSHE